MVCWAPDAVLRPSTSLRKWLAPWDCTQLLLACTSRKSSSSKLSCWLSTQICLSQTREVDVQVCRFWLGGRWSEKDAKPASVWAKWLLTVGTEKLDEKLFNMPTKKGQWVGRLICAKFKGCWPFNPLELLQILSCPTSSRVIFWRNSIQPGAKRAHG